MATPIETDALVIGAGPAGLMAAETMAARGLRVVVAEAKPSIGRKFLMAGKSGLNVTKDEPLPAFTAHYDSDWLAPMLAEFGPAQVQDWCRALGAEVFTGTSGRVFPVAMKGSPLLRAWATRLAAQGVVIRTRWRWTGFDGDGFAFDTPDGPQVLHAPKVVLALGGASWPRLGSDAAWVPWLRARKLRRRAERLRVRIRSQLAAPGMEQLAQRVIARYHLQALSAATPRPYNVNFFCHTPPPCDPGRQHAWALHR